MCIRDRDGPNDAHNFQQNEKSPILHGQIDKDSFGFRVIKVTKITCTTSDEQGNKNFQCRCGKILSKSIC